MNDDSVDFYKSDEPADNDSGYTSNHEPPSRNRPKEARSSREMSWSALEYTEHHHGIGWYTLLLLVTAILAVGLYFLSRDYFTVGSIVVLGLIVGVFASRKPREVNYRISDSGVEIGPRKYSYGLFKSFTIVRSGELSNIELLPVKRFMPAVSAHFSPSDEEKVVEIVGEHLPYAEYKPTVIDKVSQRLRL